MPTLSLCIWLCALLIPQLASALTVRTVAFELPTDKVNIGLALENAKEQVQVDVEVNQFGKPVKLQAGTYQATSSSFTSPTRLVLPEGGAPSYLLLVFARPDGGLYILPVADDASRFGAGDRFVINATSEDVAVRIHQSKVMLKPGKSSYFKLPSAPVPGNRIEVEMHRQQGEAWLPFNSTYWPLSADNRSIVLIYPDVKSGKPRVRSLMDFPVTEETVSSQ